MTLMAKAGGGDQTPGFFCQLVPQGSGYNWVLAARKRLPLPIATLWLPRPVCLDTVVTTTTADFCLSDPLLGQKPLQCHPCGARASRL